MPDPNASDLLAVHGRAVATIREQLDLDLAEIAEVWRRHWPRDVVAMLELERTWLHRVVDLHVDAELSRHRVVRRAHLRPVPA